MAGNSCAFKPSLKVAGSLRFCCFWQSSAGCFRGGSRLLFVALILYTLAFFRDPDRPIPADQRVVVAAADGTVADIEEIDESEFLKARSSASAFFFRSSTCTPIARRLMAVLLFSNIAKAFFLMRAVPECSEKNEAMTWAFQNPRATIVVRQLTGAIARRIVGWAKVGDELKRGDRFGMIRFGSRTEVYLPLDAEILVKVGDHVKGGRSCDRTACRNERTPSKDLSAAQPDDSGQFVLRIYRHA